MSYRLNLLVNTPRGLILTNPTFFPQSELMFFYGSYNKELAFMYASLTYWFI